VAEYKLVLGFQQREEEEKFRGGEGGGSVYSTNPTPQMTITESAPGGVDGKKRG